MSCDAIESRAAGRADNRRHARATGGPGSRQAGRARHRLRPPRASANQKGNRHYLVIIEHAKRADLRAVADQIGDGKLSFASPERLMTHLGLTPGSVSPFGLINDREHVVRVVLDRDLKSAERVSFHPNINTATLTVAAADFQRFLAACGNTVQYVSV
jgi:Ala-tRNA(Pro) deacylase